MKLVTEKKAYCANGYSAPSALRVFRRDRTWADGPGCHISRLWRWQQKSVQFRRAETGRWLVLTIASGWLVDLLEVQDRLQDCAEDARVAV